MGLANSNFLTNSGSDVISKNKRERLHGLDFCRATFMLLGLFFHVGLIYGDSYVWRVSSSETSKFFSYITFFIHSFRMEAFYLISGFFYVLVLSKGSGHFLKERLIRVFPPLIFCGFTFNTIMNFFSYERSYNWGELSYFTEAQWLGHLWFLGSLFVYFLISVPVVSFIRRLGLLSSRLLVFGFCVFTPLLSLCALVISKLTFDGNFLFIIFDSLLYYYAYFLLGFFCYYNKNNFINLLNYRVAFLCLFLYFVFIFMINYSPISELNENVIKAMYKLSHGVLVLSAISFTYSLGKNGSKLARSFSDSSYTVYLLHQPMIVLIYFFIFKELNLNIWLEYISIVLLTFFSAYFLHVSLIKNSSKLLFFFNGVNKK